MPENAKILAIKVQAGQPQIWAMCDPSNKYINRKIMVYATGSFIPSLPGRFIGTFQLNDGELVFHAFDCGEVT